MEGTKSRYGRRFCGSMILLSPPAASTSSRNKSSRNGCPRSWRRSAISDSRSSRHSKNADGSFVASRWRITGKNNGLLDTPADQRPVSFSGTAVWAVGADGKLYHNWVERSSYELFQQLSDSQGKSI